MEKFGLGGGGSSGSGQRVRRVRPLPQRASPRPRKLHLQRGASPELQQKHDARPTAGSPLRLVGSRSPSPATDKMFQTSVKGLGELLDATGNGGSGVAHRSLPPLSRLDQSRVDRWLADLVEGRRSPAEIGQDALRICATEFDEGARFLESNFFALSGPVGSKNMAL